ncbi:hypothetical protein [Streptomyces sp. NPDC051219]|uniref:hypothetical protein n=1 Tax=Streptomyces sp. NPDC051219 TaxID=3155283 RepID=UPI00342A2734
MRKIVRLKPHGAFRREATTITGIRTPTAPDQRSPGLVGGFCVDGRFDGPAGGPADRRTGEAGRLPASASRLRRVVRVARGHDHRDASIQRTSPHTRPLRPPS